MHPPGRLAANRPRFTRGAVSLPRPGLERSCFLTAKGSGHVGEVVIQPLQVEYIIQPEPNVFGTNQPGHVVDVPDDQFGIVLTSTEEPLDEVRQNFQRFGVLDEQVKFLPGWFDQTLPGSETGPLALLRVDCDLYASTLTVLDALYARVSCGGWVIIDDYGILPPCRQAVDEFRTRNGIGAALEHIDEHGVCWQVK